MTDSDPRATIVADLATRLRPVCTQWPDDLFNTMIERLAEITLRYDRPESVGLYDRRTTERLVDDLKEALQRSEGLRSDEQKEVS
jgi:hypothetical protein